MRKLKTLASALALAGLLTACGMAAAQSPSTSIGPSPTFNGGGPDVRGGNHEAVEAMNEAPTTTSTTQATTTTVAPTTTQAPTTTVPPTTTTTVEPISDEQVDELASSTCAAFETAYLTDMVAVVQSVSTEYVPTEDALLIIAMSIALGCPDMGDMFVDEMLVQYPEHMEYVSEGLSEAIGS